MCCQCISERTSDEERKRRQCEQCEFCVQIKHHRQHDHDLQDRDHALLNSIDQHALDRVHIFDHACHQIACGAIVEPAQRQQLNVRIQIAAQIENDFLLERVV